MGLIIHHGKSPHWWLSHDIWVGPAGSPDPGFPGVSHPIAGNPYNVWVKVTNPTDKDVSDWSLFILWAAPTAGPIPLTATTPLNETTIRVDAKKSHVFKAATVWKPSFVNHGHECLIAYTYWNGIPFPTVPSIDGSEGPDINWSVAQRNLGVVQLAKHGFHYMFQVCNSAAEERSFVVAARQAPLSEVQPFLTSLEAGGNLRPGKVQGLGLVASDQPGPSELKAAKPVLESVKVGPNSCRQLSLVGTVDTGAALIHVTQTINEQIVGGLSVVALAD
jgi:hypothetical protein